MPFISGNCSNHMQQPKMCCFYLRDVNGCLLYPSTAANLFLGTVHSFDMVLPSWHNCNANFKSMLDLQTARQEIKKFDMVYMQLKK